MRERLGNVEGRSENGSEDLGNDLESPRNTSESLINGSRNPITYEEARERYQGLKRTNWNGDSLVIGEKITDTLLAKKLFTKSIQSSVVILNKEGKEIVNIGNGTGFDDFFNNILTSTGKFLIDVEGKQYRGEYDQGSIVINGSQGFSGSIK